MSTNAKPSKETGENDDKRPDTSASKKASGSSRSAASKQNAKRSSSKEKKSKETPAAAGSASPVKASEEDRDIDPHGTGYYPPSWDRDPYYTGYYPPPGAFYAPPPFFAHPPYEGWYGYSEDDTYDTELMDAQPMEQEPAGNHGDDLTILANEQSQEENGGFDSMVKEFEVEGDGLPLSEKVANAVNIIWKKPRESEGYKNAAKRAKKPANVNFHKVGVDDTVFSLMSPGLKAQDSRMKSIQSMVCKAAVPTACLLDEIEKNDSIDNEQKNKMERYLLDNISLMSHVNNTINYQRREAIKRKLPPNYAAALKTPDAPSDTLFGEECSENLKKAGYGGKIQREVRQYQQQMLFSLKRRGRGMQRGSGRGYRARPYPVRGGRGAFLGKK
jgi:hypothetical protein